MNRCHIWSDKFVLMILVLPDILSLLTMLYIILLPQIVPSFNASGSCYNIKIRVIRFSRASKESSRLTRTYSLALPLGIYCLYLKERYRAWIARCIPRRRWRRDGSFILHIYCIHLCMENSTHIPMWISFFVKSIFRFID